MRTLADAREPSLALQLAETARLTLPEDIEIAVERARIEAAMTGQPYPETLTLIADHAVRVEENQLIEAFLPYAPAELLVAVRDSVGAGPAVRAASDVMLALHTQTSVEGALAHALKTDVLLRCVTTWAHVKRAWHLAPLVQAAAEDAMDGERRAAGLFAAGQLYIWQGKFSAGREALERSRSISGSAATSKLRDAANEKARVAREGWRTVDFPSHSIRDSRTRTVVGYVLQNSMPHTTVGYATRSADIATSLRASGWDVVGVTRPGYPLNVPEGLRAGAHSVSALDKVSGVTYHRLPRTSSSRMVEYVSEYASHLVRLDRKLGFQVLHAASNAPNGLAAIHAARSLGIPSIYEVRGLWHLTRAAREDRFSDTELYRMLERLEIDACLGADRVLAITGAVRDTLVELGVPRDKITIAPNGVDTRAIQPVPPDASLKTRLGLDGKVVIGYVGSLLHYEGLDLLVDAVAELVSQGVPAALLIVGDGVAKADLEDQARERGLANSAVFTGRLPRDEALAHYSIIDICPFPRRSFAVTEMVSPLKPFEAMASSKPIVVSSVAPLREFVAPGDNGLVFDSGNVAGLADALRTLVNDDTERRALAERGRDWVVTNRDWSAVAEDIGSVYRDLGCHPA